MLVRLAAAGVNPVETYIRAGTYARLPTLPTVLGSIAPNSPAKQSQSLSDVMARQALMVRASLSPRAPMSSWAPRYAQRKVITNHDEDEEGLLVLQHRERSK